MNKFHLLVQKILPDFFFYEKYRTGIGKYLLFVNVKGFLKPALTIEIFLV